MALKVLYGGAIRFGEPLVLASDATQWLAGRVLKMNSSATIGYGTVSVSAGTAGDVFGVALRDRVATTAGPTTSLVKVSAPTGERAEVLLSQAIVQTDQLTSGSSFVAGDTVYVGSDGRFADNTRKAGVQIAGKALSDGAAGDTARLLTFFFDVQY